MIPSNDFATHLPNSACTVFQRCLGLGTLVALMHAASEMEHVVTQFLNRPSEGQGTMLILAEVEILFSSSLSLLARQLQLPCCFDSFAGCSQPLLARQCCFQCGKSFDCWCGSPRCIALSSPRHVSSLTSQCLAVALSLTRHVASWLTQSPCLDLSLSTQLSRGKRCLPL